MYVNGISFNDAFLARREVDRDAMVIDIYPPYIKNKSKTAHSSPCIRMDKHGFSKTSEKYKGKILWVPARNPYEKYMGSGYTSALGKPASQK